VSEFPLDSSTKIDPAQKKKKKVNKHVSAGYMKQKEHRKLHEFHEFHHLSACPKLHPHTLPFFLKKNVLLPTNKAATSIAVSLASRAGTHPIQRRRFVTGLRFGDMLKRRVYSSRALLCDDSSQKPFVPRVPLFISFPRPI